MPTNAVLLDIEGTTTSISFVTDVLFPYAAARIPDFLKAHADEPAMRSVCAAISADANDQETGLPELERVIAVVRRQMAADVKATGLKQLQGLVWKNGYDSGAIKGHVYDDVWPSMQRWKSQGKTVAIYSSGSVLAQKLLFAHSVSGDLTPFIANHFDTTVGNKREPKSYATIGAALQLPLASITFCTDIPAEAEAAMVAGLTAVLLMRPGNAPLPPLLPAAVHVDLTRI
jgi:enolase-phosphatase E1